MTTTNMLSKLTGKRCYRRSCWPFEVFLNADEQGRAWFVNARTGTTARWRPGKDDKTATDWVLAQ